MILDNVYYGNTVESYIIAALIVLLFIGLGQLFSSCIVTILRRLTSRTKTTFDDILINILEKPTVFAIFIAGFKYSSAFIVMTPRMNEVFNNVMTILIVINIVWVINRLIDAMLDNYTAPLKGKKGSVLDNQLMPFVRKFLKVVVIVIGALFLLKNMGYDITSLIAGLGIGGLAFALAAQPLLSNLFGGVAIIADKPFKIGDRIKVDQKFEGYVREIGMRSTIIKTPTDTMVHIPNNIIATTAVENISTTSDNGVKFSFSLGLEYDTSAEKIEEAIEIIKKILDDHPNVVKSDDSKPSVSFWDFKDSWLAINGVYAIYPQNVVGKTRTEINLDIKRKLEKAHIKFAYPTQTLYLKNEKHHEHHR